MLDCGCCPKVPLPWQVQMKSWIMIPATFAILTLLYWLKSLKARVKPQLMNWTEQVSKIQMRTGVTRYYLSNSRLQSIASVVKEAIRASLQYLDLISVNWEHCSLLNKALFWISSVVGNNLVSREHMQMHQAIIFVIVSAKMKACKSINKQYVVTQIPFSFSKRRHRQPKDVVRLSSEWANQPEQVLLLSTAVISSYHCCETHRHIQVHICRPAARAVS